jgi:hypothetical protein
MEFNNNVNSYEDSFTGNPTNDAHGNIVTHVQVVPIQVGEIPVFPPAAQVEGTEVVTEIPLQVSVPESTVQDEFQFLTWNTCDFNKEGVPIGYNGKLWINYPVIKLQVICCKLVVHGIKNAKKEHIVESIMKTHEVLTTFIVA